MHEGSQRKSRVKKIILGLISTAILVAVLVALFLPNILPKETQNETAALKVSDLDLKLVHVVFRHGARTPADTYPNDPYISQDFAPYGWGQLTNNGKVQLYNMGKYLRSRYASFLGNTLKLDDVYAQSTGVARTKMSIQLVFAGLFPPQGSPLEWNKYLNWQPIPYNYEELDKDTLLLVRTPCPRYHEELERVFAEDLAPEMERNKPLFEKLSNITGLEIKTPDDVQSLYSTLKAELEYGLELPEWTKEYFLEKLQHLTDQSYVYNTYNNELKRLKGGVFVKKSIDDWEQKIAEKLKTKIFLYAGHDATVTNILSAFNVWEAQFPDYAITAFLEFSLHKKTGQFGVEIFLKKSTSIDPTPLIIPGCSQFCPLDELKLLLQYTTSADHESECQPRNENYTEPPLGGP